MTLPLLVVAALATWQAIELWHHGSVFAGARARIETWGNMAGELLLCPFCLSPWTAGVMVLLLSSGSQVAAGIVWILAAARLANLGNDFVKFFKTSFEAGANNLLSSPTTEVPHDDHGPNQSGDSGS